MVINVTCSMDRTKELILKGFPKFYKSCESIQKAIIAKYVEPVDRVAMLNYMSETKEPEQVIKKVDITVIQRPVSVSFECPCCDEEIEVDYKDFCTEAGDPCDWTYSKIKCPKCGKVIEIDDVSWD